MSDESNNSDWLKRPVLFTVATGSKNLTVKYDVDERWLAHKYIVKRYSVYKIAKMLGISQITLHKIIAEHKISRNGPKEEETDEVEEPKNIVRVLSRIEDFEEEEE